MIKNKQKGFSAVVLLLILILIAVIGFTGYYVWNNQKDSNKSSNKTYTTNNESVKSDTETNKTQDSSPKIASEPFVAVVQEDGSVKNLTPEQIAKTPDQINILYALHKVGDCPSGFGYVGISYKTFDNDGSANYIQDGNYARIGAGVCLEKDNPGVGGAANFLHKDSSGNWVWDTGTQQEPDCIKFDGLGYPKSILESCYDESTQSSRSPK